MKESLKLSGHILIQLFGEDGKLKEVRDIHNVIVTSGKNFLATWLAQASQTGEFMPYLSLGTGTTAAQASDTTLETEVATRVSGTITDSNNVWQNQATFAAGNATGAVTESGIFSAVTAGTMLARQVFPVINKASGDTLQITWQVTFS